MKSKINVYTFITSSLILLLPVPGRLAYGIVMLLELNLLVVCGTLFKKLVMLLKLDNLLPILNSVLLITVAVLYKQILTMISPLMALTLSYALYMPAVSSFLIGYLYDYNRVSLLAELSGNLARTVKFTAYALMVFLLRDIFGYGTITFPSCNGIAELVIQKASEGKLYIGVFWASIPGMLVILALTLVVLALVSRKLALLKSVEDSDALDSVDFAAEVSSEEAPEVHDAE